MEGIYGVDFGAKMAGTTVVAYAEQGVVRFSASAKKRDADRFLLDFFEGRPPGAIFIDAPLSLPAVYRTGTENLREGEVPDFHYRACDRELGAMSPMFLGGLTARAMKTAYLLRRKGHTVHETYPSALARHLGLSEAGYKGNKEAIPACLSRLTEAVSLGVKTEEITTWHRFDALLALASAVRASRGEAVQAGSGSDVITF